MEQKLKCGECGREFTVPEAVLAKFPGWRPRLCLACRRRQEGKAEGGAATRRAQAARRPAATTAPPSVESGPRKPSTHHPTGDPSLDQKLAEVLERHHGGPRDGLFTDGGCSGNPGPGGWGAVLVRDDVIISQAHGRDPETTNNRMELSALIAGFKLLAPEAEVTVWSDSELCVKTVTEWAPGWERRGWRRKAGPIANLALVQELYALASSRPRATLRWIKAHDGSRWNEYVDTLSTGHLR
jgi:ribonuclease HI